VGFFAGSITLSRLTPILLAVVLAGCFSFSPATGDAAAFARNAVSAQRTNVRVSVAVLDDQEEEHYFGRPLANKGIQAVWLRIENNNSFPLWLMPRATDPDYFSALETSYLGHLPFAKHTNQEMDSFFRAHAIARLVPPHRTNTGFLFTNLSEGAKFVNIELWHTRGAINIGFFLQLPNGRFDYEAIEFDDLYPTVQRKALTLDELRKRLEHLQCCVTGRTGQPGDPLNVVLVASQATIFSALVEQNWDPTHTMATASVGRTISSFLSGARYRYSPVSPLYLFGRQQDIAVQKARGTIHQRNHMRLWLSPYTYQGRDVWVGQVSRDIGVRFTLASPFLTTHKIDPDVDESRDYLVEDLIAGEAVRALALVKGVGASRPAHPARNLTGDPYFTDGMRAVLFLSDQSVPIDKVDFIPWENLPLDRH